MNVNILSNVAPIVASRNSMASGRSVSSLAHMDSMKRTVTPDTSGPIKPKLQSMVNSLGAVASEGTRDAVNMSAGRQQDLGMELKSGMGLSVGSPQISMISRPTLNISV